MGNRTIRFKPDDVYYIYGLVDPRTDKIRYVGKSYNIKSRLVNHIYEAKHPESSLYPESHKNRWIRKLISLNINPNIKLLEETTYAESDNRERYWIKFYGRENLTNQNDGGLNPDNFKAISLYSFDKLHENRNRIYRRLKYSCPIKIRKIIDTCIRLHSISDKNLDAFINTDNSFNKKLFVLDTTISDKKQINTIVRLYKRLFNIEAWLDKMDDFQLFTILLESKMNASDLFLLFGGSLHKRNLKYASDIILSNMGQDEILN